jgi:hypothetical protein
VDSSYLTAVAPDGSSWERTDYTGVGGPGRDPVGLIFHRVGIDRVIDPMGGQMVREFVVGDVVYAPTGRRDGFVARIDPVTHQVLDVQGFHNLSGGSTSVTAVDFDILHRVYVTGWTIGPSGRQNVFLIRLNPLNLADYFYQIYDLPLFGQPANSCGLNLHVGRNVGPFHVDISGLITTPNGSIRRTFLICADTSNVMPPWPIMLSSLSAPDVSFGNFQVRILRDRFGILRRVLFVEANRVRGPGSGDELLIKLVANPDTHTFDEEWSYDYPGREVASISVGDSGDLYTAGREGSQAFVDRFSPDGSQLLRETLLGGQTGPSSALAVLETGGSMYVTGRTEARDFPVDHADNLQPNWDGHQDAFITKYGLLFEPQAFQVQGPGAVTAGVPFTVTVTVQDQQGNRVTGYDGGVHFTSSDGRATLPADYTFTTDDNGSHTFTGVVLRTAGRQTVTATDLDTDLSGTLSVQVDAGGLLVNGGFETGDFTGWAQSGNTGYTFVGMGTVHGGQYAAALGPVDSEGFLAQTFATTAGATYTLDYWLQHDGGSPSSFHAMINGNDLPGSVLTNPDPFDYREYTFTFTATGPTTELKFGFQENPAYFHLDDVSVRPAPVPPGAAAGHAALVGATLSPVHAPAAGGGVPVGPAPGPSGGSRLRPGQDDTLAALSLRAFGGGLPAPLSAADAFDRLNAARRPAPREAVSATAALDGLFSRLGEGTIEV